MKKKLSGFTRPVLTICCLLCIGALFNGMRSGTGMIPAPCVNPPPPCVNLPVPRTPDVSIVTDKHPGPPAAYALRKLSEMLVARKIDFETVTSLAGAKGKSILVAGLASGTGAAAQLLKAGRHVMDTTAEALTLWKTGWQGKPVWVVNGFDDRGLMYGLLDIARRVSWSSNRAQPWSEVKEITEKPYVAERGVSMYTMTGPIGKAGFITKPIGPPTLICWLKTGLITLSSYSGMKTEDSWRPVILIFLRFPGLRMCAWWALRPNSSSVTSWP